jgi:hypothetical protein
MRATVSGAYYTVMFTRAKRLHPLQEILDKLCPTEQPAARSLEDKIEAARKFFGTKKKPKAS